MSDLRRWIRATNGQCVSERKEGKVLSRLQRWTLLKCWIRTAACCGAPRGGERGDAPIYQMSPRFHVAVCRRQSWRKADAMKPSSPPPDVQRARWRMAIFWSTLELKFLFSVIFTLKAEASRCRDQTHHLLTSDGEQIADQAPLSGISVVCL